MWLLIVFSLHGPTSEASGPSMTPAIAMQKFDLESDCMAIKKEISEYTSSRSVFWRVGAKCIKLEGK